MLTETDAGLYCQAGDFYIDPWGGVARAIITHAHGDHARFGSNAYLCSPETGALLKRRFGEGPAIETLAYGRQLTLGDVRISFHPSGHILGSAQVRLETAREVWVISGDYKRAADPTCQPFEPLPCDTFITESTFGLPIYRWDPARAVIDEIAEWWAGNRERRLTSLLFCYTLGKAQRVLAELGQVTDRPVYVHGMLLGMLDLYRAHGVRMLDTRPLIDKPRGTSFAGELVLAPLSARGTPWMRRLGAFSDGFVSGLMRVRGVRRQRAFDRGFVLSDHADWLALLDTIAVTGASRVLVSHGHAEPLARFLRSQGRESGVITTSWEHEDAEVVEDAEKPSAANAESADGTAEDAENAENAEKDGRR
jgi:putative mRNA 3-end processing factor